MMYRVSRKEHPIPVKEYKSKKEAIAYAKSFRIKSGVPVPTIEKINSAGKIVGKINLLGEDILETGKATSDAQLRAQVKYDKAHTTGVYLKLNKENDADIIEKLESVENRQGYLKKLIKEDLKKCPLNVPSENENSVK